MLGYDRIAPGVVMRRAFEDRAALLGDAKALDTILAVLKTNKAGLRSEQLREQLKMDKKEMPRVLKAGLDKKVLKSKGQKRATTYTAS